MAIDSKRVQAAFLEVVAADLAERDCVLELVCAGDAELRRRVELLLRVHDDSGELPAAGDAADTGAFEPGNEDAMARADLQPGVLFAGRYKLREKLGEGGMGVVWVADQTEPVQRRVALKVIKAAGDSRRLLARFEQERQALALMDHPNIAKVFDAGVANRSPLAPREDGQPLAEREGYGTPFFVMELIKGVPLTKYCDEAKLTPKQRLELFIPVCHAVQHAHQKGIIHRDLKPSNILIGLYDGRPVPKVIDFGVAKATGPQISEHSIYTEVGAMIGTLEYMSPEQAELNNLDIDTRSDIYALGVILYELLTGGVPFSHRDLKAAGFAEMLRIIKEVEPPRPSTRLSGSATLPSVAAVRHTEPSKLTRLVRGELDWIVMKCLEKDRSWRYETANGLALDIQRYLTDEPVVAGPPSTAYRLRKFVRRNKPQVIAATLVFVALLAGIAGTTFGLILANQATEAERVAKLDAETKKAEAERQKGIAQRNEQEAKAEADKAKKARDFLVSIFELSDANGQRGMMTARQILDDAEKRIPNEFANQPEMRAEVLAAIETVYGKITANSPLAMLLEVSGTVYLQSTRDVSRRAIPQALLYSGDRLTLAADAHVQLVILSDLHKERLRPGMEATVRRKGCEPADAIKERVDDVLMPFVRLPKGTFYMGWDGTKKGVKTEIKDDFEIAMHDVTQGQWQAIMNSNPSYFSRFGGGRDRVLHISDEELKLFPVESVSRAQAQEFIEKLNQRNRGSGWLYRLPTEAEWEYACRGGATSEEECSYHFYLDKPTNSLSSEQANFNGLPLVFGPDKKYLARTTRVGAYSPNRLGLCDMHGNVRQWCDAASGGLQRGGSWNERSSSSRAATRPLTPTWPDKNNELGLRLVRVRVR